MLGNACNVLADFVHCLVEIDTASNLDPNAIPITC
jgi:hypothetical protein